MLGPGREAVLVEGDARLEVFDALLVLEEEDGAVAGGEALDLGLGRGELRGGNEALEDLEGDVPQLLVLVAEEEDSLAVGDTCQRTRCARDALEDIRGCSGC